MSIHISNNLNRHTCFLRKPRDLVRKCWVDPRLDDKLCIEGRTSNSDTSALSKRAPEVVYEGCIRDAYLLRHGLCPLSETTVEHSQAELDARFRNSHSGTIVRGLSR